MTTTEAKNCQTCGHSPAAWAEGGLILIQCIQPTCASIAIIGGHTLEMAAKAWDAYQTTNKDKSELRATNRALLEQLDEARAAMRTPITPAALDEALWQKGSDGVWYYPIDYANGQFVEVSFPNGQPQVDIIAHDMSLRAKGVKNMHDLFVLYAAIRGDE